MKSTPQQIRLLKSRRIPLSPHLRTSFQPPKSTYPTALQSFSTTSFRTSTQNPQSDPKPSGSSTNSNSDTKSDTNTNTDNESKTNPKDEKKKSRPDTNTNENLPPQSPFTVFMRVFKEEIEKNKGWQDNVKQLQGDVDKFADSAALKKSKEIYERMRITALIKSNPRLQAAVSDLQKTGHSVQSAINHSLQNSEVLKAIASASGYVYTAASTATQPIRDTAAYKVLAESVEEAFEDRSGSGGGWGYDEKDVRRERRRRRREKAGLGATKRVEENPDAGEALVLSSTPAPEPRLSFLTSNPTYQSLLESYRESESPLILTLRSFTSKIGRLFDETETAQTVRRFKEIDPDFNMDSFLREVREYVVPEVVDGYLSADREGLQRWCGEATFNMLWATVGEYIKKGLISDSKVLDINNVDIVKGSILENDIPVWVISFQTQELLLFRNAKTGEAVVGSEDAVQACNYALVLTRDRSLLDDELTGGWKVVEIARRAAR